MTQRAVGGQWSMRAPHASAGPLTILNSGAADRAVTAFAFRRDVLHAPPSFLYTLSWGASVTSKSFLVTKIPGQFLVLLSSNGQQLAINPSGSAEKFRAQSLRQPRRASLKATVEVRAKGDGITIPAFPSGGWETRPRLRLSSENNLRTRLRQFAAR